MIEEPRRVHKRNIWQVIYDIRPAIRSWEDEVKYRLRPRVVDFGPVYRAKLRDRYLIREPVLKAPPQIKTSLKARNQTVVSTTKKGLFYKTFPVLIGLFLLAFIVSLSFDYHSKVSLERKNNLNRFLSSTVSSLNQWQLTEAKAKLNLINNRLNKIQISSQSRSLDRFLADLESIYSAKEINNIAAVLNNFQSLIDKVTKLKKVDSSELFGLNEQLTGLIEDPDTLKAWQEVNQKINYLATLLGLSGETEVLVIFEDPQFLRPDGGLMLLMADLRIKDGQILDWQFIPTYQLDKYLTSKIIPPLPLRIISPNWLFHDLNWSLDTNFNATLIEKYLKSAGWENSYQLMAFTDFDFLASLINIIGPINIDGLSLDAQNSKRLINQWAEEEKQLMANNAQNFFPLFASNLKDKINNLNESDREKIFNLIINALNNQTLRLKSADTEENNFIKSQNWLVDLKDNLGPADYFALSGLLLSNKPLLISGVKVNFQTKLQTNNDLINYLSINISHAKMSKGDGLYLKIYLPQGITILKSEGSQKLPLKDYPYEKKKFDTEPLIASQEESMIFDSQNNLYLFKEEDRSVIGAYLDLNSTTSHLDLYYRLPFSLRPNDGYQFILEKPLGLEPDFSFSFKNLANNREIIRQFKWQSRTEITLTPKEIYD